MQKKVSVITIVIIILSFWVTACSTITPLPTSTASPSPTPTSIIIPATVTATGLLSPKEALELMYGKDREYVVDWQGIPRVILTANNGYTYAVEINTFACFWEFSIQKCFMITDWSQGTCHICGVQIEGAVFERTPDGWVMREYNSNIALVGSFGYVSKGELLQIGDQKHAVLLKSGYSNQGFSRGTGTIIAETDNSLNVVFEYLTSASQNNLWKYTSELNFSNGDNHYYRIGISYFGTDDTGKTPATQVYTFSETEYVLDEQK
jgi:hypothetical protein